MNGALLELGVGGIFAILVLREVFAFLSKRKTNGVAGERTVEYWQQQQADILNRALHASIIPILDRQTMVLERLERGQLLLGARLNQRLDGE